MTALKAHVEPAPSGNGYIATVTSDEGTIYSSISHEDAGIFPDMTSAQQHADAWATAVSARPAKLEEIRQLRKDRLPAEVDKLDKGAADDLEIEERLKKAAKAAKENAEQRRERIPILSRAAEVPRVRVEWTDRNDPASVKLIVEPSVWDHEFVPTQVSDPRQLQLRGIIWDIEGEDSVVSASGHGRFEVNLREDGELMIKLGDEHEIRGTLTQGGLELVQPKAAPAPRQAIEIGALKPKQIRERLEHVKSAETIVGLAVLERRRKKKPRAGVLKALAAAAADHEDARLLDDLLALEEGRAATAITPDLAAAALLTATSDVSPSLLEQLVPECLDALVIDGLLDEELQREENSRDEVVAGLRARLAELTPAPE